MTAFFVRKSKTTFSLSVALCVSAHWSAACAGALPPGLVAAGGTYSCAVSHAGVQCWGSNEHGQLGNGTMADSTIARPVHGLRYGAGVTSVSLGETHACAIANGGLQCWGSNEKGQLGTGDNVSSSTPRTVFAAGAGVSAVASGFEYTCAVVDGGLQCWGANDAGQFGTGDVDGSSNPRTVLPAGSGVTAVVAGTMHMCAIVQNALLCSGNNDNGQLGTGDFVYSLNLVPVVSLGSGITAVAAGPRHTCAVVDGTQLSCWGYNNFGQLGDGTHIASSVPVSTPLPSGVIGGLSAGSDHLGTGSHTCAIVADVGALCWGLNDQGQLGDGTTNDASTPVAVQGLDNPTSIATGSRHSCAMSAEERIYCWGYDTNGQLGDGGPSGMVAEPELSPALNGFSDIAAGSVHACAIFDARAYCWGFNSHGELGNGTYANNALPVDVSFDAADTVQRVATGWYHSCAVIGGDAYCWGKNDAGQLGDGTLNSSSIPVAIGLAGVEQLDGGAFHTCAVMTDGGARCWGHGLEGELGNGTFTDSTTPAVVQMLSGGVGVPLANATSVSAGKFHSCAVVDGGARCWGQNRDGQLGDGSQTDAATAVAVSGLDSGVVGIGTGESHSCALVGDAVKCWGYNGAGRLGDGTGNAATTPVSVLTSAQNPLAGATVIAVGVSHSCAVVDGGVMCWGANDYGQLGIGTFDSSAYAVAALPPGSGIVSVTAGDGFTCAWSDALTWCWGFGYYGRMGNGSLGYSLLPVLTDELFGDAFED